MQFYIEVDDKRLRDRLGRFSKGMDTVIPQTVFDAAEYAKQVATTLVPVDTGETLGGIRGIVAIQGNGVTEARVGFMKPMMRGSTEKVNLPAFMTYSKYAVEGWRAYGNPNGKLVHFTNGDPRFLIIAKEQTWEKFKKDVEMNTGALLHD